MDKIEANKITSVPRTCSYGGKVGHQRKSCWKKSRDLSFVKFVFIVYCTDKEVVTEISQVISAENRETKPCISLYFALILITLDQAYTFYIVVRFQRKF